MSRFGQPSSVLRSLSAASPALLAMVMLTGCQTGQTGQTGQRGQTGSSTTTSSSPRVTVGGSQNANTPAVRTSTGRSNAVAPASTGARETVSGNVITKTAGYPTGNLANDPLILERSAPATVNVGEEYSYDLKVTNRSDHTLHGVALKETLASGFGYASASGNGTRNGGDIVWNIGDLGAGQSQTFTVTGSASGEGELTSCATVAFEPQTCITTQVVDVALELVKTAPESVLACETFQLKYRVTNPGSGIARGVSLTDELPAGLTTESGQSTINANIGDLGPGQSRDVLVNVKVADATVTSLSSDATASSGALTASDGATTSVSSPDLAVTTSVNRDTIFLGRTYTQEITVTNEGTGPANDATVAAVIPAGVEVKDASAGYNTNTATRALTWSVGDLAPGASETFSITCEPDRLGEFTHRVTASGFCADDATDTVGVATRGIPAILLEVVDLDDPILVGDNVVYRITVTNQGSADGTGINIVAQLEAAEEFVSGTGSTAVSGNGQTITMAPVDLAPGAEASWDVTVKAVEEANVRFAVEMTYDQDNRPVNETESTNLYR